MKNKKIVIVSGGTGGHIYPSLELAKSLVEKSFKVLLIARRKIKINEKEKINYKIINIKGWDRKLSSLFLIIPPLFFSLIKSLYYLYRFSPSKVITFGSYLSLPVGWAAYLLRIPLLIHEQNLIPGLANKFLARIAKKILITFDKTEEYLNKYRGKIKKVGLPIRKNIGKIPKEEALQYFSFSNKYNTILVFGGSQGAHSINLTILKILPILNNNYQLLWICGKNDYEWLLNETKKINFNKELIRIFEYLEEIAFAYGAADLVIARSGASTLAELTACKLPAILVPYPYATSNHQLINAYYLKEHNVAEVILDNELTPKKLINSIKRLLNNITSSQIKNFYSKNNKLHLSANIDEIISLIIE